MEPLLELNTIKNCTENQYMVCQNQYIESCKRIQNPLFIQHEQRKNGDAGHSRYIKQTVLMYTKEKEVQQYQSSAKVLIKRTRTNLRNV